MDAASIHTPTHASLPEALMTAAEFSVAKYANYWAVKLNNPRFFSPEDREDLVGTALLKAWGSIDRFNPAIAKFQTWVDSIVRNCVKDRVDYKLKRADISREWKGLPAWNSDDDVLGDEFCDRKKGFNPDMVELLSVDAADKETDREEFEACVLERIARLDGKDRLFLRALMEGDKPKDMALRFGCSANAAAIRVCKIRKALRGPLARLAGEFGITYFRRAC